MSTKDNLFANSRLDEPEPTKPAPERRRRRKRPAETDKPEPNTLRDHPTPEVPHNPQDLPNQELRG